MNLQNVPTPKTLSLHERLAHAIVRGTCGGRLCGHTRCDERIRLARDIRNGSFDHVLGDREEETLTIAQLNAAARRLYGLEASVRVEDNVCFVFRDDREKHSDGALDALRVPLDSALEILEMLAQKKEANP